MCRFSIIWPVALLYLQLLAWSHGTLSSLQAILSAADEVSALFKDAMGVLSLLTSDLKGLQAPTYPRDISATLKDGDSFQYIVVGAGAAGAVVAARLAQAGREVLLVEAGGDPGIVTRIPGAVMALFGSNFDWAYPTLPNNKSCLAFIGGSCHFHRGRCLGGSTSTNFMLYVRGNRKDFDDWNVLGWTWNDVQKYFLRSEGLQDINKFPPKSRPYHNTKGELKVGYFGETYNSWHQKLLDALQSLGFPLNPDANGELQVGVTNTVGYVHNGERMSTARAFLTDKNLQNKLKVAKDTHCTGVLFEKGNENIAKGIKVNIRGKTIQINARNEVILSAGALGTPQILMLSGIGRAAHLKKMGINVRLNLPIGENMSDHVLAYFFIKVNKGFESIEGKWKNSLESRFVNMSTEWLSKLAGPLKTIDIVDILTMYNSSCFDKSGKLRGTAPGCDVPNLQFINFYIAAATLTPIKSIAKTATRYTTEVFDQIWESNRNHGLIVINVILLRPYSRGYMRLASTDGSKMPAIYPNFFSDIRDVKELAKAAKVIEALVKTKQFKSENASLLRLKLNRCPKYEAKEWEYWQCYVRHMSYSVQHAVGSAALGSCVGRELRVAGTRKLRVADLSVAPLLSRGNTEALAVAIGERLADFILNPTAVPKQAPKKQPQKPINKHKQDNIKL